MKLSQREAEDMATLPLWAQKRIVLGIADRGSLTRASIEIERLTVERDEAERIVLDLLEQFEKMTDALDAETNRILADALTGAGGES